MSHYDDEELSHYVAGRASYEGAEALEAHLGECRECAARLAVIENVEEGLRDELPWRLVHDLERPAVPPAAFLHLAEQLERERAEARGLLAPVIVSPITFTRAAIDRDPRFHSSGVVEGLCAAAEAMRERQPLFALQLADMAIFIATKLQRLGLLSTPSLLGRAWTERMVPLILIGRFQEAEQAADNAERAYDDDPRVTPHELAVVWLHRSILCVETARLGKAQFFATVAASKFAAFGDRVRLMKARLANGNVLFMRGRYDAAAADLEEVVRLARGGPDRLLLLRAVQSLGESYAALSRFDRALACFMESYALAEEGRAESEKMRSIWSIGYVLLRSGEFSEAISRLDEARRGFEALGVVNDAALVRLQIAEAMLAAGRHDEVAEMLDGIAVTFAAEGMSRNANLAVAYAREAAGAGNADAALLQHVRTYLEQLPRHPDRPFAPPR